MDRGKVRKFAIWARIELINSVEEKAKTICVKDNIYQTKTKYYKKFIEEIAYNWFVRICSLRFMDVNGYLKESLFPKIYKFFTNNKLKKEESLKKLVIQQCDALNSIFPNTFQKKDDYSNLYLPDNLFEKEGVVHRLIIDIPEIDWKNNIQIIGWLFQYYNSELKDKIFEDLNKNIKISKENIPTATQLFTPDWIVRYMVENSVGRKYIESCVNKTEYKDEKQRINKEKQIAKSFEWNYYLTEAEQQQNVRNEIDKKSTDSFALENFKIIDPCMGSGHILVYVFDVLMKIYQRCGYKDSDAVKSILINNLYGLDIDDKVTHLAYFTVMMKARQYDSSILNQKIQTNIEHFQNLQIQNAEQFGSLIKNENFMSLIQGTDKLTCRTLKMKDLLSQKYDVVITNPPYMGGGGMNQTLADFMKNNYPNTKTDLFAAFIERGLDMAKTDGYSCMVTMQNWMFIPSFEKFRKKLINEHTLIALLHMENMIMGIAFGTAVSIFRKEKIANYIGNYNHIKYADILNDKPFEFPVSGNRFACISTENFNVIPGSPIAYWADKKLIEAYEKGIIGDKYEAVVGIQTGDNNRFLKYWFEVPLNEIDFNKNEKNGYKKRWYPHPKGGAYRKWYGNFDYVVNWQNDGEEIRRFNKSKISIQKYNRNGICWSHTTNGAFSARKFYKSSIPNLENPILFCDGKEQKYLLALLNSKVTNYLLNMINSTMHYHVGDIIHLPLLKIKNTLNIEKIADECVELTKKDWDSYEFSWNFAHHPMVYCNHSYKKDVIGHPSSPDYHCETIAEAYAHWQEECKNRYQKLASDEEYLNKVFIELYGLECELTPKIEEKYITIKKADKEKTIKSFLSYFVGCLFGRYSLDEEGLIYTGGKWNSEKYGSFIPEVTNIIPLCENKYFDNDIISRLEDFLVILYGKETLEQNLDFIAQALGGKDSSRQIIRKYFINSFFKDHCKIYQKRPIYWLFDSGKNNGFKCLIYMHRYKADIFATIRNNYLLPMQAKYLSLIKNYEKIAEDSKKLAKIIDKLRNQYEEIQSYDEKLKPLAYSCINIDFDDGIKHNYALFASVLAKI